MRCRWKNWIDFGPLHFQNGSVIADLDYFPENLGDASEEQGESFHHFRKTWLNFLALLTFTLFILIFLMVEPELSN